MSAPRWNHNLHYTPLVLRALPQGARRALDVGCGEGELARALRRRVLEVVGVDRDAPTLAKARAQTPDGAVDYVEGDVLTAPLPTTSFDLIACVAVLHHMDAEAGLARMRDLLAPGGVLVVVALTRHRPADLPRDVAAAVATRVLRRRRGWWESTAPVVLPPPLTSPQLRAAARRTLGSDVRARRHLLWRESLVWRKPAAGG